MMSLFGYILIVSQGVSVIRKWWSLMLIALALNTSYLIVGFCNYNFNHDYVLQLTQRTVKNAVMDSTEPMTDSPGISQGL